MDIIAAYREVGTYRGAAAACNTTHKTVKRVIARHEAGGSAPGRGPRGHNYDAARDLVGTDLAELNTLRAAHGQEAFLDALNRAVAFGRWRPADIRSILAAGPGLPGPRVPAGDALDLDLPAVPVRPLTAYAIGTPA